MHMKQTHSLANSTFSSTYYFNYVYSHSCKF